MSLDTEVYDVTKSSDRPIEPLSWHQTWMLAISQPSIATFERIMQDPLASARRAYLWIFVAVITGSIIQVIVALPGLVSDMGSFVFQGLYSMPGIAAHAKEVLVPYSGMIFTPAVALVQIPLLVVMIALRQWIAGRILCGSGTYASLVYATAAYWAPIYILSSMLSVAPYLICLSLAFLIYSMLLAFMAVMAVNRIGWGGAAVSVISVYLVAFFVIAVLAVCGFIILGPEINKYFQNTIRELESAGVAPWHPLALYGLPWLTM